jgi:hypothetical protein
MNCWAVANPTHSYGTNKPATCKPGQHAYRVQATTRSIARRAGLDGSLSARCRSLRKDTAPRRYVGHHLYSAGLDGHSDQSGPVCLKSIKLSRHAANWSQAQPNTVLQPLETAQIAALHVQPGQIVKKGQVLAVLDPTFINADLAQSQDRFQEPRGPSATHGARTDRIAKWQPITAPPASQNPRRNAAIVFAK